MAESIFSKARTLILGNAHSLIDMAIDKTSVSCLKQHLRDLEKAVEDIDEEDSKHIGDIKTEQEIIAELDARIKEVEENIYLILNDGDDSNDGEAITQGVTLEGLEAEKEERQKTLDDLLETKTKSQQVLNLLKAKQAEMKRDIIALERSKRTTEASNRSADAISKAAEMLGKNTSVSVDNIAERIKRDKNIADAKLDKALEGIKPSAEQNMMLIKANARIKEMKKKMQAEKTA